MRLSLTLVIFCLAAQLAAAETVWDAYTGDRLLRLCESKPRLCEGYILGIVDARYTEGTFCLGGDAQKAEITRIVKRYLEEHSVYAHVDASDLVIEALAEEFPCG